MVEYLLRNFVTKSIFLINFSVEEGFMGQERYDASFKKKIVELYKSGTSASKISEEFNISETSIYNWTKNYSKSGRDKDYKVIDQTNFSKIQLDNILLKEEVEVLKKALKIILKK